jgi:RNA polymerase sigma-70 factor (ECF subfamily)
MSSSNPALDTAACLTPAMVSAVLVANYSEFSRFLEQQVGSGAVSEDILKDAFVHGMHKLDASRPDETTLSWFYRLLRSAVIEQPRYADAFDGKLGAFRAELEQRIEPSADLQAAIRRCLGALAATLEPDHAAALLSIDLGGLTVNDFAGRAGVPAQAAQLRVDAARAALRRQVVSACGTCIVHGCWNCTCGSGLAGYGHSRAR